MYFQVINQLINLSVCSTVFKICFMYKSVKMQDPIIILSEHATSVPTYSTNADQTEETAQLTTPGREHKRHV